MMKRLLFLMLTCLTLASCSSVHMPSYIQDDYPYQDLIYADYDKTVDAVRDTLISLGWEITDMVDPAVYERNKILDSPYDQHTMIFTDVRQTRLFVGTRYQRMNIYLKSIDKNSTHIEVRYLTASSFLFKTFYAHKNDAVVKRIINAIEENI